MQRETKGICYGLVGVTAFGLTLPVTAVAVNIVISEYTVGDDVTGDIVGFLENVGELLGDVVGDLEGEVEGEVDVGDDVIGDLEGDVEGEKDSSVVSSLDRAMTVEFLGRKRMNE